VTGFDLVVIGDCNPDVLVLGDDVAPAFGQQEKLVGSISLVIGGSAAITAVAAARLGLRVALAAAIGPDAAGDFMLAQLAAEGVDTSAVVVRQREPTGMTVALSSGGDRAILTATGAMASLTAADVPAVLLRQARHVHVSSYFLLERSLAPGLAGLLAAARSAGASTSLDTNWDPAGRWGGEQLRAVLRQVGLLLPNQAEALRLSGTGRLADAVAALTAGGRTVAVKLGPHGVLCCGPAAMYRAAPPATGTPVIDATGAGDCCNAGLITGLLRGMDLAAAAGLGCAVGTASTRAAGGTASCPDLPSALALAQQVRIWQPAGPGAADLAGELPAVPGAAFGVSPADLGPGY
jgi:sugar/nucleoside kinase (ribokinase family)